MVLVRVIILVTVDVLLELSRRIAQPQPSHTDETDGDDAEDKDADVLLACRYSECDCWEHYCSYAVLRLGTACSLLLLVSILVWLEVLS